MSKIVVVEESSDLRHGVEETLRAAGHEVLAERSGRAAIARLESETPDLVLTGLELPDLDGLQVCTFVKQSPILSATPVLLLARAADDEARRRARRAGAAGVLELPIDTARLVAEARRALGLPPLSGDGVASAEASREAAKPLRLLGLPKPPTTADELGFTDFDDLPSLDLPSPETAEGDATVPTGEAIDPPFSGFEAAAPEIDAFALDLLPLDEAGVGLAAEPALAPPPELPEVVAPELDAGEIVAAEVVEPATAVAEPPAPPEREDHRFASLLDELAGALHLRFGCLLHTTDGAVRRIGEAPRLESQVSADVTRTALLAAAVSAQVGLGRLQHLIVEAAEGTMLVQRLPESYLLVLGVADASALGKARFLMRKVGERLKDGG